ncbi:uncharacterized protein LOC115626903 [Scaptodrosophila lebanonensis]|uniref:Uncharacterized protein LOC115626903 n=1 Tax=Drosophila lebanonensis TaxID=7225 RepID=A0A6J2TT02_DROLE|nr:uncharacterized protein LOC115626903 [Scaptodrosophila lebanonensis]
MEDSNKSLQILVSKNDSGSVTKPLASIMKSTTYEYVQPPEATTTRVFVPYHDPTQEVVDKLPDCGKLSLDRIELFPRTLRCRKIEIFDFEEEVSFTGEEEEEMEATFTTEDATSDGAHQLQLLNDLDCLLRRIGLMQMAIKERKKQEECELYKAELMRSENPCRHKKSEDLEEQSDIVCPEPQLPPLSCEEQMEIRDLEHDHHTLQCYIDEMVCRYKLIRCLVRKLQALLCLNNQQLRRMAKLSKEYLMWSKLVEKEKDVCTERYKYLTDTKIGAAEVEEIMFNNLKSQHERLKEYLHERELMYEMNEFHEEIDEMTQYCHDLHRDMEDRFDVMERQVTRAIKMEEIRERAMTIRAIDTDSLTPLFEVEDSENR